MDALATGVVDYDAFYHPHVKDQAWASTAEACLRFAASIALADHIAADLAADLAAPWRQISAEAAPRSGGVTALPSLR